jgi:hypothetical protein
MRQQLEDDAQLDKEQVVNAPDKFKTKTTWKVFSEAVEMYLSQLLGYGMVPLSYVKQRNDPPDTNAIYVREQEQNIDIAPLQCASYQHDNARVNRAREEMGP